MQLTALLSVVLSTVSLTSALARRDAPSAYNGTNSSIVCSQGGCIASFNIKADETKNTPGFNTHCEGPTPNATVCNNTDITTHVKPLGDSRWNVWVQHKWDIAHPNHPDEYGSQAGDTNITYNQPTFQILPDKLQGVA